MTVAQFALFVFIGVPLYAIANIVTVCADAWFIANRWRKTGHFSRQL